jgi:hypothetical protein
MHANVCVPLTVDLGTQSRHVLLDTLNVALLVCLAVHFLGETRE